MIVSVTLAVPVSDIVTVPPAAPGTIEPNTNRLLLIFYEENVYGQAGLFSPTISKVPV